MRKLRYEGRLKLNILTNEVTSELQKWIANNPPSEMVATCASCIHCQKAGPMFCRKYKLVPPVAVIVGDKACDAYMDDVDIPF